MNRHGQRLTHLVLNGPIQEPPDSVLTDKFAFHLASACSVNDSIRSSFIFSKTASTPPNDDSTQVAKLNDSGGEVTIDKNGRVTGLDNVPENSRQYIARAALSEQIQPSDVLRRLSGEQSGLRGDDNGGKAFRLLYPLRRVITEDRLTFRWESLSGATNYRVYVLDVNSDQVAQSEELSPTQTQWRAPTPLRRGQIFSWVVTALVTERK
jgi:hypothetical protein